MEQMLLDTILLGLITGFAVAQLTSWLDFAMDYGHFLGHLRLNKAFRTAKKLGNVEQLEMEIQGTASLPADDQVARMERAYWDIARLDSSMTLWLCKYCFGSRLSLLISTLGFISVGFDGYGLLFFMVSNSFFWYMLK